jgi:hypothetical protein
MKQKQFDTSTKLLAAFFSNCIQKRKRQNEANIRMIKFVKTVRKIKITSSFASFLRYYKMATVSTKVQAAEIIDLDNLEKRNNNPNCDIQWSDLNFKVGDKYILQNCWGNVRNEDI